MAQITYRLDINKSLRKLNYRFSFGNTRNISLGLNKTGASVSVRMSKDYTGSFENSYLYNLVKESIRRIALLYLLQYQKPLLVKTIELTAARTASDLQQIRLPEDFVFYQMFDVPLLRTVRPEWKDPEILQNLLKYQRAGSRLSRPVAALYAYLFSKTKNKESERFFYLWIAMNGYFASRWPDKNDRDQLTEFLKASGLGNASLSRANRESVCKLGMVRLSELVEPLSAEDLEGEKCRTFADYISHTRQKYGAANFDMTPHGFLLTDFPYYLRCTLFHAQRPIELFSFKNDMELKSLRIVNSYLEDFLDRNLHTLFEQSAFSVTEEKNIE